MIGWATEKMKLSGQSATNAAIQAKLWWETRGSPLGKAKQPHVDASSVELPKAPSVSDEADVAKVEALDTEKNVANMPQFG